MSEREWLDAALLALVAARGPAPEGQGWYVSAAEAEQALLGGDYAPTAELPPFPAAGEPLAAVAGRLGLSPEERLVIAAALAGELDSRYGRVYGFLHDDLTRTRPSLQICLRLARLAPDVEGERVLLDPRAPVFRWGLVRLDHQGEPRTTQPVVLDPELLALLAGVPGDPPASAPEPAPDRELTARLAALIAAGEPAVAHFHGTGAADARWIALAACAASGVPLVEGDLAALAGGDFAGGLRGLYRRVLVRGGALHLTGFDALERPRVRELAGIAAEAGCLTAIEARRAWAPAGVAFVAIPVDVPGYHERRAAWRAAVPGLGDGPAGDLAARFRLTAGAIAETAAAAGGDTFGDLVRACESDGVDGADGLVRLVRPRARWDDLVLPEAVTEQLHDLCDQIRHRATVLHEWGFDRGASRGTGLVALFLGASGTGKTLAAEVVAHELGTDLVHVDLAAVVSKYIGETEKNLERVLAAGDRAGALLLFDEADALFGKRSEVHDAHDRYANLELSFLLQRLEQYEGVAILASNFAQNIDAAFMRRIQLTIELPFPDEEARRRLWRVHLPDAAPIAPDVDPAELARAFKLAGGGIRKIAVNAAFLAASGGGEIETAHLVRAARREYERAGRPFPGLEAAA